MLYLDQNARTRHIIAMITALSMLFLLAACGQTPGTTSGSSAGTTAGGTTAAQTSLRTFTIAELAQYDGQNGQPAYIAIDGIVYDVTNVTVWDGKKHAGRFVAGKDYTEALKTAPHTADKLKQAPQIGTIAP
jgi:predicted heme/steroid binding protein